jgi:Carboxypeptidase regulatory-like domain
MTKSRHWAFIISLIWLIAAPARAQTSGIAGTVKVNNHSLAAAGVSAYLLNSEGNKTVGQWATVSAADGRFAIGSLPYGTYAVIVRYQGKIIYQAKIQLNTPAVQQLNINVT